MYIYERKEKIKIDYCGFWGSFKKDNNLFYILLSKYFDVKISSKPDYVICSNRGKPFEYMKYDCPRIMFMGENLSSDFTVFYYVMGFDYIGSAEKTNKKKKTTTYQISSIIPPQDMV